MKQTITRISALLFMAAAATGCSLQYDAMGHKPEPAWIGQGGGDGAGDTGGGSAGGSSGPGGADGDSSTGI